MIDAARWRLVRVRSASDPVGGPLEGAWMRHLRAMEAALAHGDLAGATRAWDEGYARAAGSSRWEGLVTVGDAALRLGAPPSAARAFESRARRAYLAALFRAHEEGVVDGVLRVAAAFAELGDGEVVERCLTVAEGLATGDGDPGARERVRLAAAMLRDRPPAVS